MTTTEWTAWQGGECPVAPETITHIRCVDDYEATGPASNYRWTREGQRGDIIAYRIVSPTPPTAVQAAVEAERQACADIAWSMKSRSGREVCVAIRAQPMAIPQPHHEGRWLSGLDDGISYPSAEAAIRARGNVEGK